MNNRTNYNWNNNGNFSRNNRRNQMGQQRRGNFGQPPRRQMRNYNDFGNYQNMPMRTNTNGGMRRRRNFNNEMGPLRSRRPSGQMSRRSNMNNRTNLGFGALRSRRRNMSNNVYNNNGNAPMRPIRRIRFRNNNQMNNNQMNNSQMNMRRVRRSSGKSGINPNHAKTLYLFNLNPETTVQDVRSLFNVYGRLTRCAIHYDKETGKSLCTGVVRFTNESNKQSALNDLQSKI